MTREWKTELLTDEILLKHAQVQALPRPSTRNHRSVFNWIWTNKPLAKGYDDYIYFANDMVTTKVSRPNYFEEFIEEKVHTWPISMLKVRSVNHIMRLFQFKHLTLSPRNILRRIPNET
tara:strand:- start:82 stop:438 length:357 start_codon:yes stop_codon:yes gene_type:complete